MPEAPYRMIHNSTFFTLWDGPADDTHSEAVEVRFGNVIMTVREPWCGWLRRHGIDPNDVVVPGWIRRNREAFRVEYLAIARDADGQIVCAEHGERHHARTCRSITGERFVQLEGPPLRFPAVPFTDPTDPPKERML